MADRVLPTGTVTFLFSDIEGSTKLLQKLGDAYSRLLEAHGRILRSAIEGLGGIEVSTEGDSFFAVFPSSVRAVEAAARIQRSLAEHPFDQPVRVRIGLHTGEGRLGGDNYVGIDVNRAARIAGAGHGGQVLLSDATRALIERSLPAGVRLLDLGNHRLKDLAQPERLYQLTVEGLPSDFPPPRSLDARPNNLPLQLTTFIGREGELAEVKKLLLDGARLLTLTGPGGTGKTRLALQAAAETLPEFQDGVYFVDLAPVSDPALVVSTIAETLGVKEDPEAALSETLQQHISDKRMLLVLDNFEQVVGAGSDVIDLLQAAPGLRVLVTSREVLRRYGEQEFPVPPLALPDPDRLPDVHALRGYEAVALFVERARAVRPEFAVTDENASAVAEITTRLDGLPLAIELAAGRINLLAPQAILDRLGQRLPLLTSRLADAPERRRTLRATIDWSYELLDEEERRVFEHVSVFMGGGSLEAMEAVCSLAGGTDTFEGLASLVDKSLLRRVDTEQGEPRFVMLETIREYALDRLTERGEREALSRRHAEYFLTMAERAEPNLTAQEAPMWLHRLTQEHDNIRAALRWSVESLQREIGLNLAGAMWRFWQLRAHFREARAWFDELLALPGASGPTAARAKALTGLGGIAYWQSDYPSAEKAYAEALSIHRDLGDPKLTAFSLMNLSYMPPLRGDLAEGRRLIEEAVGLFEAAGEIEEADRVRAEAGYYLMMEGDLAKARPLLEQAFRSSEHSGDAFRTGGGHHMMGQLERLSGNLREAAEHYRAAIRSFRGSGNDASMLEPLEALGSVASREGNHERAVRLVGAARAARELLGGGPPPEWLMPADVVGEARKALGDHAVERALEAGGAMSPEEAAEYALGGD